MSSNWRSTAQDGKARGALRLLAGLTAAVALGCSSVSSTFDDGEGSQASDAGESSEGGPQSAGTNGSGDASSSGGGFVNEPPKNKPSWVECDIWNPSDCAEGSKCMPVALEVGSTSWDTNVCRPIMGDAQPGDPCHSFDWLNGLDDCADGSFCWDPDPVSKVGMCIGKCGGSPAAPMCPGDQFCNMDKNGIMPMCMDPCPPLDDDCPVGCSCQASWGTGAFNCAPVSDEPAAIGEPCESGFGCESASMCVGAGESACVPEANGQCCAAYCDVSAEQPCEDPLLTCELVFEGGALDPQGAYIGVCVSPEAG